MNSQGQQLEIRNLNDSQVVAGNPNFPSQGNPGQQMDQIYQPLNMYPSSGIDPSGNYTGNRPLPQHPQLPQQPQYSNNPQYLPNPHIPQYPQPPQYPQYPQSYRPVAPGAPGGFPNGNYPPPPQGYYQPPIMINPGPQQQYLRNANKQRNPVMVFCSQCQRPSQTIVEYNSGGCTYWICSCIATTLVPCWCIPICCQDCKDALHYCPNCKKCVGVDQYCWC